MAVVIPAAQAAVSAVAAGITVGSIAWAMDASNPWAAGGVAAGVFFGVSWLVALAWWRERIDGQVSAAPPVRPDPVVYPAEVIRVELQAPNPGGLWVDYLDLPFDRDLIIRAAAYLRERDYDTSNMGGAGKVLTRSQAEAIRDWMISNDLAAWVRPEAHTAGWGILPEGRAVIRRLHHLGIASGVVDPPPGRAAPSETEIYGWLRSHTNAQTPVFPAGLVARDDQDTIDELWEG